MVQHQANLSSSTYKQHNVENSNRLTSRSQQQRSNQLKSELDINSNHKVAATQFSLFAWKAMLERSNRRLEKYGNQKDSV